MRHPLLTGLALIVLFAVDAPTQDRERRLEWSAKKEHAAVLTRCLTWLTGTGDENDYVSVGRLANDFGFVHFRVSSGHTVNRAGLGGAVVDLLSSDQLFELNREQAPLLAEVRAARVRMNDLLESMLDEGREVEREELVALGREFGRSEAQLGGVLAARFARIHASLDADQLDALHALRARWEAGRGAEGRRQAKAGRSARARLKRSSQEETQEFWNLATRLLTWLTGTPEQNDFDTAGKPSQHFGFVSLRVESGHAVTRGGVSDGVLEVLDAKQESILREVVEANRADFETFFAARAGIHRELERGLAGEAIRPGELAILGAAQGEAEARMTWRQALGFLDVRDSLEEAQALALLDLRERYLDLPPAEEAAADSRVAGRRLFRLCALCHVPQGEGRAVGPPIESVFGRPAARVAGFEYSAAMRGYGAGGATWNEDSLDALLLEPRAAVPGTAMGFRGLPDPALRRALIDYLRELGPATEPAEAQEPRGPAAAAAPASKRPNIVLLLSDDQSWDGLSVHMDPSVETSRSAVIQTPNLERLAREGRRFSRAYSPAPVCSPTRASLQTGKSPAALGWTKAARSMTAEDNYRLVPSASARTLADGHLTIGELLQGAGYRTAHFGKWHLGGGGPGRHGYDVHDGDTKNADAAPFVPPNPVDIFGMTDRACAFMDASVEAERPFFVQLSFHALHYPENALPETIARYAELLPRGRAKQIQRAALAENLDTGIGRLLAHIDELGIEGETYVLYTSDNGAGGRGRNSLRGGKGGVWEGGVRVPFLVRGAGVEPGSASSTPIIGFDLFPTFAALAGSSAALPGSIEGGSLVPVFRGESERVERARDELVFHFPHYQGGDGPHSAILVGSRKLYEFYEGGELRLYDLDDDPAERRDLAATRPAEAKALATRLRAHLSAVGARFASVNTSFDPAREPDAKERRGERERRRGGGRGD